jgi:hypothetical protein
MQCVKKASEISFKEVKERKINYANAKSEDFLSWP